MISITRNGVMHGFHTKGEQPCSTANLVWPSFLRLSDLKFSLKGSVSDVVVGLELRKSDFQVIMEPAISLSEDRQSQIGFYKGPPHPPLPLNAFNTLTQTGSREVLPS